MKRINLSSGPVEYRDTGSGPIVLFVHGLLVNGELWTGVAECLAATHRCLVPDWPLGSHRLPMQPGADQSPAGVARLVAELMEALDLRDVTLVGNDTGGAICQLVAADHGERVGRLVLTNCDALEAFPPKGFGHLVLLAKVPGALSTFLKSVARAPALGRIDRAYGALTKRRIPDALLRAWTEPGANDRRVCEDALGVLRGVAPEVTLDVAERLAHFRRPVRLLWAREDPYFTLDLAKRLAARLPLAEIVEINDALTFCSLDQPDAVARGIAELAA